MHFYTARQLDYVPYREATQMGQQFAAWLNITGGTKLVLRLLILAGRIRELNDEYTAYTVQLPEDGPEEDDVAQDMAARLEGMVTEFDRLISRCQVYPHLTDLDFQSHGWTFRWDLVRAPRTQLRAASGSKPTEALDDLDALLCIVRLAQHNMLPRLRQCHCNRWYFERVKKQQFCSSRCRQFMFSKSEEFRAHRREYMRRYYRLKMSGKVK